MSRLVINAPLMNCCGLPRAECRCRRAVGNAVKKKPSKYDWKRLAKELMVESSPADDAGLFVRELAAALDDAKAELTGAPTDPEDLQDQGIDEATEDPALTGNAWVRDLLSRAARQRLEEDARDCYPPPQPDYAEPVANDRARRQGQTGADEPEAEEDHMAQVLRRAAGGSY